MNEDFKDTYSIKDLATEFNVTARTLRHYEEQGLLAPARSGQTRVYSQADRIRLAWILRGRRVGFSLNEISEMLALYSLGDGRATQRQVTLEKCRQRIDDLKAQRDDINSTIADLEEFCDTIEILVPCQKTGKLVSPETGKPPVIKTP
ncbi:hypothetical protein GCM10017044_08910 [Kordiimonas sediminis]|uniref:HTH merR-type domain-containing protein n=1 Tax=Kordiimonas sediminis TaxID=1735581 RepID=A0A919AP95_9PROT|nr:MerR family DNA-binding transcriptional regulator [Kordiimonas sediminis]GHF16784.1 hypothetical protein GCM10017044_08910 [Kordiimonas sediminis]